MADQEGNTSDGGTMRSPEGSASPHEWTPEEMSRAIPLPLPMTEAHVEPTNVVPASSPGNVSEGGLPE